jgi:hypothetical protein
MTRLAGPVLLLGVLTAGACKPESARRAEQAAGEVTEARERMRHARQRVNDLPRASAVADESDHLVRATTEFERTKAERIQILRAQHEVIATQPKLIATMATNFPLTDAGRADVNERLTMFQRRLDEAADLIQGLEHVDATGWTERDEDVIAAMKRLEDARKDAWEALRDAPKGLRSPA